MLGKRFRDALTYAAELHAGQTRKGTQTPYVAHVLGVCSLLLEDGGDADEAIAALLHDAVEDQDDGKPERRLAEIHARFGPRVAAIVEECTETLERPKPPWPKRKAAHLAHLEHASDSALRVTLADKLYNAASVLRDYRLHGDELWSRFNKQAGKERTLRHYAALAELFSRRYDQSPMAQEFDRVVGELLLEMSAGEAPRRAEGSSATGGVGARSRAALGAALKRCRPDASRDVDDYVTELEDNLLSGVGLDEIAEAFAAGAGQELEGKMRAPWSSSALAVNSFAPWSRDLASFRLAGIAGFGGNLGFEVQCPNGVSRIPPHLDVLLRRDDRVVAVESKCTEYLTGKRAKAAAGYLALAEQGDERASSRWFAALGQLHEFRLLDAYQLVKHYLGLRLTYPGLPLTLVYLFWEPANAAAFPLFTQHRDEIERFGELVAGDQSCRFSALSYPEHWHELECRPAGPFWLHSHLAELRCRYEVEI